MGNIVYNEDCMTGMKRYEDKYFDVAICDIPYGIDVGNMAFLKETKTTVKQKNGTKLNPNRTKEVHEKKDWDKETPSQEYFDELVRISKHQIIFGVEYVDWKGLGSGRIKWIKHENKGLSFKTYELAYCSAIDYTEEFFLLWSGMMQAKSLKEPTTQQANKKFNEKRIHPCHKPVLLYDWIISRFGFEGCKIIDTHVGGGSIRISADKLNCSLVGFEIDKKYFDKQENRYKKYKSQYKINFYGTN